MRRVCSSAFLLALLVCAFALAQADSPTTRALSLRVLQARLSTAVARGEQPREVMELAGITRITGYLVDENTRDLIVLGEVEPGATSLRVDDLAIAFRSVWLKYADRRGHTIYYEDPGCSIDPDPAVVQQLSELARIDVSDETMDQWCDICDQPQRVRVMGVPFDSRFAKVMVDADYLMKRLADGSIQTRVPGFVSLGDIRYARISDELKTGATPRDTRTSLNRFWFYPGKAQFREQDGVTVIQQCPVTLLTEEQHLTAEGLTGLRRPDPEALRFAQGFSAHYDDIANARPIYQELEGLFRMVALAKLVKYDGEQVDLDYLMNRYPAAKVKVARTLPGVSRVQTVERKRDIEGGYETVKMWMPSCGGVNMGYKIGPDNYKRTTPRSSGGASVKRPGSGARAPKQRTAPPTGKKKTVLKARPSPDSLSWDVKGQLL
jgi:hypothetical protein